jgi:uncharacterized phiE125 gp8 family phage protein
MSKLFTFFSMLVLVLSVNNQAFAQQKLVVAGYGGSHTVPEPIKQAILLLVGAWFENREAVLTGTIVATLPFAVDALLAPYRVVYL